MYYISKDATKGIPIRIRFPWRVREDGRPRESLIYNNNALTICINPIQHFNCIATYARKYQFTHNLISLERLVMRWCIKKIEMH